MLPTSAYEEDASEKSGQESTEQKYTESRLAALARELVEKVGVEGAIRYCSSLGWRGVRDEVEILREHARAK